MGDNLKKVQAGDALRIPAETELTELTGTVIFFVECAATLIITVPVDSRGPLLHGGRY